MKCKIQITEVLFKLTHKASTLPFFFLQKRNGDTALIVDCAQLNVSQYR